MKLRNPAVIAAALAISYSRNHGPVSLEALLYAFGMTFGVLFVGAIICTIVCIVFEKLRK